MNKLQWSVVNRIKNFLGIQPTFEPQQTKFIRRILEGKNMLDIAMFLVTGKVRTRLKTLYDITGEQG